MRRSLVLIAVSIVAIAAVACGSDGETGAVVGQPDQSGLPAATATTPSGELRLLEPGDNPAAPVGALDTSKSYTATFKTVKGDIVVDLLDDIARFETRLGGAALG